VKFFLFLFAEKEMKNKKHSKFLFRIGLMFKECQEEQKEWNFIATAAFK